MKISGRGRETREQRKEERGKETSKKITQLERKEKKKGK